jgi:protease-4
MSFERAEYLARGRVWIGSDAFELGLVDQLGGLDEAIEAAAERANLDEGEYGVIYIEPDLSFTQMLALEFAVMAKTMAGALGLDRGIGSVSMLDRVMATVQREIDLLDRLNDPRGLYYHCFCDLP